MTCNCAQQVWRNNLAAIDKLLEQRVLPDCQDMGSGWWVLVGCPKRCQSVSPNTSEMPALGAVARVMQRHMSSAKG